MKFIVGNIYTNRRGDKYKLVAIEPSIVDGRELVLVKAEEPYKGELITLNKEGRLWDSEGIGKLDDNFLDLVPTKQVRWGIIYTYKNGRQYVNSVFNNKADADNTFERSQNDFKTAVVKIEYEG